MVKRKLDSLQILRCLAAGLVIVDHSLGHVSHGYQQMLDFAHGVGALGVEIFFVLSGFIMVVTSGKQAGSLLGAIDFAFRRIIRVVPLYWIATGVSLFEIARSASPELSDGHLVKSLLFIPYPTYRPPHLLQPLLGQGWTLNYEVFFYAIFAVALLLPGRRGPISCFVALIVLSLLHPFASGPAEVWTGPLLLLFGAGILLGLVRERVQKADFQLSHPAYVASSMICAVVVACWWLPHEGILSLVPWAAAIASIAVCTLTTSHVELSDKHPLVVLGDASYSTYLFHTAALLLLWPLWPNLDDISNIDRVFIPISAVLLCSAVGYIIYLIIERPMTSALNSLWRTYFERTWHRRNLKAQF